MKAVCFDLDGTLYDDREYVKTGFQSAARYLREKYEIKTYDNMIWEYSVERNFETVFDRILECYKLPESELERLIAAYHDSSPTIHPYPEVETVLSELPVRCRTAVITGGKRGEKKIQLLGLDGEFDEVYVTPQNETSKHKPKPFETVLDILDISSENTVFIGDNPELDFYWPNRLGMTTVWSRRRTTIFRSPQTTDARPDYVLPDLSLVPEIVNKSHQSD
jgi:putative hydrolase of the HAD superfamily